MPVPIFVFQVFPFLKVPNNFRGKYIKNQRTEASVITKGAEEGEPQPAKRAGGAAPPWVAPGTLLADWWAPRCPLHLYLALGVETPNIDLFLANSPLYRRRRRSKIGAAWRSCPGTLPEGGTPSARCNTLGVTLQ